jgi:hypothetical protein
MKLVAHRCPSHPSFVSLCTETEHGGTRVLGGKCCPNQYSVRLAEWNLTRKQLREMIDVLENDIEHR